MFIYQTLFLSYTVDICILAHTYTLPGQKYSSTTKYPCTDCAIYRLNIQLGAKVEIEIYRYQKFVLLTST